MSYLIISQKYVLHFPLANSKCWNFSIRPQNFSPSLSLRNGSLVGGSAVGVVVSPQQLQHPGEDDDKLDSASALAVAFTNGEERF